MADHAVGRIDRLVAKPARKAAERQPEGGRHDAVGKIFRQTLDRRAGDAELVEPGDVAADDGADGGAAPLQSGMVKRGGDGADMEIEAALRDRARSDKGKDEKSYRPRQIQMRDRDVRQRGGASDDD